MWNNIRYTAGVGCVKQYRVHGRGGLCETISGTRQGWAVWNSIKYTAVWNNIRYTTGVGCVKQYQVHGRVGCVKQYQVHGRVGCVRQFQDLICVEQLPSPNSWFHLFQISVIDWFCRFDWRKGQHTWRSNSVIGEKPEFWNVDLLITRDWSSWGDPVACQCGWHVNVLVTWGKVLSFSVTWGRVLNVSVTSGRVLSFSVTSGSVLNFSVNWSKVPSFSVTWGRVLNFSVTWGRVLNFSVTSSRVLSFSVTWAWGRVLRFSVTWAWDRVLNVSMTWGRSSAFQWLEVGPQLFSDLR